LSLQTGTHVGPYEILSAIGAGGMGEVYRARDTKLGRDVAIKVLLPTVADDPDRLARFRREAQVLASLNHSNIAQIYGVEDTALVMELVDGETLDARIRTRPLAIGEALLVAKQIAEAVEAAHEAGIIHRDLKPSNIKIRPDDVVKVLDFGLAKAFEAGPSVSDGAAGPTMSPTLTAATSFGVILGTAAYMAPEQAKGRTVDKRADIFAFGCVLYELLTGRRAFEGEDISDTLAFVLTKEPAWDALPSSTPPSVTRLLRRCLEKDPKRRLRDIGEGRIVIDDAVAGSTQDSATAASASTARRPWAWMAATALFACAIPAAWMLKPAPRPDERLLQMEISPPEGGAFLNATTVGSAVSLGALSPDGRYMVFRATGRDGKAMLWLRALDSRAAVPLPGTENGSAPFWSPDSRWVAFTGDGKLQRISVAGGPPQVICTAASFSGTWNSAGVILFAERNQPLQRVSASGGTPSIAIGLDSAHGETSQAAPHFLPDGRRFLYSSGGRERGLAALASLDGKVRRFFFLTVNSPPSYAPNPAGGGWILFVVRGRLFARAFDADKGEFTGEAAPLADGLTNGPTWSASNNTVLAFQRNSGTQKQLTWFDRNGTLLSTVADAGLISAPRISPDGKVVAFARVDQENADLWLTDLARDTTARFTLEPGTDTNPVWTFDGNRVLYTSVRGNDVLLVSRPASGLGEETIELKGEDNNPLAPIASSRDGRVVAFSRSAGFNTRMALASKSDGKVRTLENETMTSGSISADGRWLAFSGFAAGRREIFVQAIAWDVSAHPPASKRQISNGGGSQPAWRADGKEIFYIAADGRMMAVTVEAGEDFFRSGTPRALFQTHIGDFNQSQRDYDVSADGQRFLIPQPLSTAGAPITVIVNWPKLLPK